MDLFLLKKVIGSLIMPVNIILLLLIFAIVFYRRKPRLGFSCLSLATLTLLLASMPIFSDWVMAPIEDNYEAFTLSSRPVDYIVVLGCGHQNNPALPATSRLNVCSLQRLVEAIRIFHHYPQATIITSGGTPSGKHSNAQTVKQAAISLGIDARSIVTENFAKDTEEEAELIAPRVIGKNVVLVTNSDHMPRAMKYFQALGINPIAAPAGQWASTHHKRNYWYTFVPSSRKLLQTTRALHESIGRLVQWLKHQLA
jgi:uncharacterized SAM-binding protein YcdF (DUF218 family)